MRPAQADPGEPENPSISAHPWPPLERSKPTSADHSNMRTLTIALDNSRIGDWAHIKAPNGEFTFKGEYPKVVMIAGGIGITPFRSMIRYCADKAIGSEIVMLYGNRREETIAFREELDILAKQNLKLKVVYTLSEPSDDWKGRRGYVTPQMIKEEISDYMERVFYMCGPPAMVTSMIDVLKTLQIAAGKIRTENFSGY